MKFQTNYTKFLVLAVLLAVVAGGFYLAKNDLSVSPYENEAPIEAGEDEISKESDNRDVEDSDKEENLREEAPLPAEKIISGVPFAAQAPFGDWKDPRQQHGCEEASLLMAFYWIQNEDLPKETALREILALSDFEEKNFNNAYDLSIADTLRLWNEYFSIGKAFVEYDISIGDIKREIVNGNLVVVPINGAKLKNPYYTAPGPEYHEMVVIGYDDGKRQFITHDPGTRHGESYRYSYDIFIDSIRDYKTGFNEPVDEEVKAMLVIGKS